MYFVCRPKEEFYKIIGLPLLNKSLEWAGAAATICEVQNQEKIVKIFNFMAATSVKNCKIYWSSHNLSIFRWIKFLLIKHNIAAIYLLVILFLMWKLFLMIHLISVISLLELISFWIIFPIGISNFLLLYLKSWNKLKWMLELEISN